MRTSRLTVSSGFEDGRRETEGSWPSDSFIGGKTEDEG